MIEEIGVLGFFFVFKLLESECIRLERPRFIDGDEET